MARVAYNSFQSCAPATTFQSRSTQAPMSFATTTTAAPYVNYGTAPASFSYSPAIGFGSGAAPVSTSTYTTMAPSSYAAPTFEYVSEAPTVTYMTAPSVEYAQPFAGEVIQYEYAQSSLPEYVQSSLPTATYVQSSYPTSIGGRDLCAMGNVVSSRVISVEELAMQDRFFQAESEYCTQPAYEYITECAQPAVEYVSQPSIQYVSQPGAVYTTAY